MLNEKISLLLNNQINFEFYSAYFYLDIYNYFMSKNLDGFGNWFFVQVQEEKDHAILFIKYMHNNGEEIELKPISSANKKFENFKAPLEQTYKHEQKITEAISTIYSSALSVNDFRTTQFLDWFIKEQGEEEKNAEDLTKRFDLFGNDAKGLYLLDNELKARVYAPPTLVI
ncbi:ferritin [Clostridium neuense]|uniref:Ferritin n=1 Tax=Clostridium neuense TaxID=1728934 RepID=A0ABW8TL13_9CLOT